MTAELIKPTDVTNTDKSIQPTVSEPIMTHKALNIHQKIVQIRKEVTYVKKDASGHQYKYATESQILSMIRERMDELNVTLEQEMESMEIIDINGKTHVSAHFSFTWTDGDNPADKIIKNIHMLEPYRDVKTIGALMTYSMKYHLYKFFNVPTDELDPDKQQERIEKSKIPGRISEQQVKAILELIGDREDILNRMTDWAKIGSIEELTTDKYDIVLNGIKKILKEVK